jgi:hypothetical protein
VWETHIGSVDDLRGDYQRIVSELRSWQRRAAPVWNEIVADLENEEPDLSEHPWPEGRDGDEHPDPLFDSCRDYVEQIAVYKRFQGKSTEDGRRAPGANKARYDSGNPDAVSRRERNTDAVRRHRERKRALRAATAADGGAE